MSPTTSSPRRTRKRLPSVTVPIAVPLTSHFSHSARTASTLSGVADAEHPLLRLGDHDLERLHVGLAQRDLGDVEVEADLALGRHLGRGATSGPPRRGPARPPTTREASSSSEHSRSLDSSNGSPTCTDGRLVSSSASSSAEASTDAPPMPSRPVDAPNSTRTLPTPAAALRIMLVGPRQADAPSR